MGRLFDLSFSSFVTPSIVKVIFVVGVVFASIAAFGIFIGLAQGGGGAVVLGLIVAPLLWFFYVLMIRVMCEIYLVVFRIEENTRAN